MSGIHDYLRKLTRWRRGKDVIHFGRLTHFVPENNVYVYFRHNDDETVMVILNGDDESRTVRTARFAERMDGYRTGVDILTDETVSDLSEITVPARGARVIELR